MAYDTNNSPGLIAQKNGSNGGALWFYESADSLATVLGDNYISNGQDIGMEAGDLVWVRDDTNDINRMCKVQEVSSDGATLIQAENGLISEITSTGSQTVTPGVQLLKLNHNSTIINATIADSLNHVGIFVVRNTSGSGTAAHTLTLTNGTFDGTNNKATLNAPAEELAVIFFEDGSGAILENTGSVALSSV